MRNVARLLVVAILFILAPTDSRGRETSSPRRIEYEQMLREMIDLSWLASRLTGSNEKAIPRHMLGLDYLRLIKD